MLDKLLLELGYSDNDIVMIKYNRDLSMYSDEIVCDMINRMFNHLFSLGYSNDEILRMTALYPSIFRLSTIYIDNKFNFLMNLGYSLEDVKKLVKNNSGILLINDSQISSVISILNSFGNNNDEVIDMTLKYSYIFNEYKSLGGKFKGLLSLGFSYQDVNEITRKNPSIYGNKYYDYCEKINYLKDSGISSSVILKLTKECEFFNFILLDDIKKKIRDLNMLGFNILDIDKMLSIYPSILILYIGDIIEKMQFLISLGFSYSYVLTILRENALIFSYSKDHLRERVYLFYEYGYSFNDIKVMVLQCSKIFDIDLVELIRKLEFLKLSRLSKIIVDNPSNLLVSSSSVYSRYVYLKSIGKGVGYKSYSILFVSDDEFSKKYQVNMNDVMVNFDDNKLLNSYIKRKTIKKKV